VAQRLTLKAEVIEAFCAFHFFDNRVNEMSSICAGLKTFRIMFNYALSLAIQGIASDSLCCASSEVYATVFARQIFLMNHFS
jgi:hypothetical protein